MKEVYAGGRSMELDVISTWPEGMDILMIQTWKDADGNVMSKSYIDLSVNQAKEVVSMLIEAMIQSERLCAGYEEAMKYPPAYPEDENI